MGVFGFMKSGCDSIEPFIELIFGTRVESWESPDDASSRGRKDEFRRGNKKHGRRDERDPEASDPGRFRHFFFRLRWIRLPVIGGLGWKGEE